MSETAIVGENIEVIQTKARSAFAWSVVIAGALAAWAVAFIFISLGSGIGLAISTPYSGPSATAMTIGGAIWLVFAETAGFAVGGYLAARLRIRDHVPGPETKFRDAAHGFMTWVVGVALMSARCSRSASCPRMPARQVRKPRTRRERPRPTPHSGRSWRCCSARWRRRLPACSAANCATKPD